LKRRYPSAVFAAVVSLALGSAACSDGPSSPSGGSGGGTQLGAPAVDAPGDDEQLSTLRPTLVVRNGTSSQNGTRTYEFQVAADSSFATVALARSGVAENSSGKTSLTVDQDLQSTTRYYWRARLTQGTTSSAWSPVSRFRTKAVGYNNAGELFDPLVAGETVGAVFGTHTWVPGRGIRLETASSYVRYALPATVATGEFSMEIEGLIPNNPVAGKPRVFSMLNGTGRLDLSKYQMNVQYRGSDGNPNNAIAFKAVWGDEDVKLEPELHERLADVRLLDPSRTYFWQSTWDSLTFRLVVRENNTTGNVLYDRAKTSPPGYGPYAPTPHYAYLGANEKALGGEDGTVAGIIIRNVWLSNKPRPASLGSAVSGQ
jgi:hypothetical protein